MTASSPSSLLTSSRDAGTSSPKVQEPSPVLLVLGMHRSGTSAVAGTLSYLGAHFRDGLLPANIDDNPMGYWEPQALVDFHEKLLREQGLHYLDFGPTAAGFPSDEDILNHSGEIAQILTAPSTQVASRFLCLKDPRMPRFLPLWRTVAEEKHVHLKAIVVLRHPLEVAASLQARDKSRSTAHSWLSWFRHLLDAERHSRGLPREFVFYDDLLENPAVLINVLKRLDLEPTGEQVRSLAQSNFLKRTLCHHAAPNSAREAFARRCPDFGRMWDNLRKMAVGGGDSPVLLAEMDGIAGVWSQPLAILQAVSDHQIAELNRSKAFGTAKAMETAEIEESTSAATQRLRKQVGQLKEEHQRDGETTDRLRAENDALSKKAEHLAAVAASTSESAEKAAAQVGRLTSELMDERFHRLQAEAVQEKLRGDLRSAELDRAQLAKRARRALAQFPGNRLRQVKPFAYLASWALIHGREAAAKREFSVKQIVIKALAPLRGGKT